ncbi:hypothetical protein EON65_22280, partial [archaeon]
MSEETEYIDGGASGEGENEAKEGVSRESEEDDMIEEATTTSAAAAAAAAAAATSKKTRSKRRLRVSLLNCDLGQPELTPPGVISLH